MTQSMGMADFFALEAGEYLERLDVLLQASSAPASEEFVRLSRALRGSALMASQIPIARVAGGLETLARGVREGRLSWDAATRQLATRAVDDLKAFVRRASSWSEADSAKAEALILQLEPPGGRPAAQLRAAEALGLDAGARAFVAREGAAIASALDRAAQTLRLQPLAQEPLQVVLRALQPLRGLAALTDLPPLPDLLDGIERAIGELARATAPIPDASDLFGAGARAIAQSAREVAERGRPDPDGAEFQHFAQRLLRVIDNDAPVVPIESLFHSDAGPHVIHRGTPAARPATLGRLELVTHGDHLRQAADSLERAPSTTQRELRAHALAGTFRSLANAGGGALADAVARFANAGREAVTSGAATTDPASFAAHLRRAGSLLGEANTGDETALAAALDAITATVSRAGVTAPAPVPAPQPSSSPATAPASPPPPIATRSSPPIPLSANAERDLGLASPTDDTPPETADLVGSWVTYRRLMAAGAGTASLDELLGGSAPVEIASLAPSVAPAPPAPPPAPDPQPIARAAPPAAASHVVDIRSLLFRGESAVARARALRAEARSPSSPERLQEILDELGDLVALAIEPSA